MNVEDGYRWVLVKLPAWLPNDPYAAIVHAFFSVLEVADLSAVSSVVNDNLATDEDLNREFDRHSRDYPWGA